ncbi:hypothetical protein [Mitsuokella multacida]|mgnify:CR=1 FL=1|uniref:hypothetical protein n=1 Tax=Mitsuokella multacida TaxID=52226 RepID=UPI001F22911A|nr:hypothetical protein [Mitsuokella multacida]MCF2585473.1 hypothetical protein [Mitsuokella multacida]
MSEYNIARDVLEFRLTGYRYGPDSFPMAAVEIYINGENFREKVCKQELPFAKREGNPEIAGHAPITRWTFISHYIMIMLRRNAFQFLGVAVG